MAIYYLLDVGHAAVAELYASVKNDSLLFVKADKSTNFYKLDVPEYKRLLEANITKT